METYNTDPKPGRIILPLVLIGMIATTYTFINRVTTNNNLEIVSEETTSTTSNVSSEESTTTTTTTTIPAGVVQYLEEITGEIFLTNFKAFLSLDPELANKTLKLKN